MTNRQGNGPFLGLISLLSLLSVAMFVLGAFSGSQVFALGFVLIFTSLLGWTAYLGIRSNSMVYPGRYSGSSKGEQPTEKAGCATAIGA